MKITEISFTPKTAQKRALLYSEHSSQAKSLHLFFQHQTAGQQRFLLEAFRETVRRYLSMDDLLSAERFLASLIVGLEHIAENRGLTLSDLQGTGLFLLLQAGNCFFVASSLDDHVQVRHGDRMSDMSSSDSAFTRRLDLLREDVQENLFPQRLRDVVKLYKMSMSEQAPLEIVLGCREDERGAIFNAVQDAEPAMHSDTKEFYMDVLSKPALYIRFDAPHALQDIAGSRGRKETSLSAPFGRVHTAAIVATAAVIFIAGAAWFSGRFRGQSTDLFPVVDSQQVLASGVQPSMEPVSSSEIPPENESLADPSSVRLELHWKKLFDQAVTSSPAISGPRVIFGCRDGKMRALSLDSGAALWTYQAGGGIGASPAVAGNSVIGADYKGTVFSLDAETGKLLWSSKLPGRLVSSPCIVQGRIVIGCFDNFVYCLSLQDGKVLWNAGVRGRVWGTAAAADESIFVPSYDGNLYAISAGTGVIEWTYNIGGEVLSSPAILGKNVVVGGADGRVHAVDCKTGAATWIFRAGAAVKSAVFSSAGRVYFGSQDAHLFCVDGHDGSML
ncbi:MAG: PQQ-binding-like beta-propeller repeat protein, partial [Candidatus Latescibacterota bacterium]